jgi:ribokinase
MRAIFHEQQRSLSFVWRQRRARRKDQLIFVTDGSRGATVYQVDKGEHIEPARADAIDPTGAGDTFCGATLAALTRGLDGAESAFLGAHLAALVIEHPGSQFYF